MAPSSCAMLTYLVRSKISRYWRERNRWPISPSVPNGIVEKREPASTAETAAIPRTIFQTWKTRVDLPSSYGYWSTTFRAVNPQYEYVLWDDDDNLDFITRKFSWFLPYYTEYPREIFRADVIRLFFLLEFGGFYADLDTECVRSLDPLLHAGGVVLGRMGDDSQFAHSVPNAIMASVPRQLFWALAISMAIERASAAGGAAGMSGIGPEELTGPVLIKAAYDYYITNTEEAVRQRASFVLGRLTKPVMAGSIALLEPTAWYPLNWNNTVHDLFRRHLLNNRLLLRPRDVQRIFPKSYLVTYWTHSW